MPNIGLPELLMVLVIALVVFGPKRLPQMGKQLGQAIREFRTATSEIRSQIGVDDIAGSVNDLKSSFSLTGDTQPAAPAATPTAPDSIAPAAVTAAVTGAVTGAALTEPAGMADEDAPDTPQVPTDEAAPAAPEVPVDAAATGPAAVADESGVDNAAIAAPSAPQAPSAPDAPAPSAALAAGPDAAQGDPAGVETFGKLRRSSAPAAASTTPD